MQAPQLTFNLLTFNHLAEEYTFHFQKEEKEGLTRIHKTLVPSEVIELFEEQEHYYTSFTKEETGSFAVTKKSKPDRTKPKPIRGVKDNTCFGISILKRYYNALIANYFKSIGLLVKPNFVSDTEVWIFASKTIDPLFQFYHRFSVKVQIARITNSPELLISYEGKSKVFKESLATLLDEVPPEQFNWVIAQNNLYKYKDLPDKHRRNLKEVFPVLNFEIRDTLNLSVDTPSRDNKYLTFHRYITYFINNHLLTDEFRQIIPLCSDKLEQVPLVKINTVSFKSNQLRFGDNKLDISPLNGLRAGGPLNIERVNTNLKFFYICHESHTDKATEFHKLLKEGLGYYGGLSNFLKIPCYAPRKVSLKFKNKENPLPEIKEHLLNTYFDPNINYIAIYISPFNKDTCTQEQKKIYYKIKELLLLKEFSSQVIDVNRISSHINYQYSLNNIAIAVLAKVNGIPWILNTKARNELIVGIGAFKNNDLETRYVGSAFSFTNNGNFSRFDCFLHNQTDELAGSILDAINDYVSHCHQPTRLIIHYYKEMSREEFDPIERGLKNLGLDIPVYIVAINKTESRDIIALDENWQHKMPLSGTFINIGRNRYLLFNNTRYDVNSTHCGEGYPFPIKIHISCNDSDKLEDRIIIRELIDQVYQFSRMYWKSVKQQNLPVTIKYPSMVAEIFPYFDGNEIPEFGKDNLWFL